MPSSSPRYPLELLAPAGDSDALDAALAAGADAVYFGVGILNARRRARNLRTEDLAAAVRRVHDHGARAYLTLNTDITERELGQAARLLELARQAGVDAVLVRDPALLAWPGLFPNLSFHLSTQGCATNAADVAAARRLGLSRVVLARELSLPEIAAAAGVPGIETELFVQGALCYGVSGRCLLSSWGGGRSGNRGLCASPCRVPWRVGEHGPGQVLSMRDLSAVDRLEELSRAGVTAIKIEGRMKNAAWVAAAVRLYRQALDGAAAGDLHAAAADLGAYTGRRLTSAYLDGQRDHLTGTAGREDTATAADEATTPENDDANETTNADEADDGAGGDTNAETMRTYALAIAAGADGIRCRCTCEGQVRDWVLPRTQVRRAGTGVAAAEVLRELAAADLQGFRLAAESSSAEAEMVLAPRTVRGIRDQLSAFLHQRRRQASQRPRLDLPEAVRAALVRAAPDASNTRMLGERPDRVRLSASALPAFARAVPAVTLVVEGAAAADLDAWLAAVPAARLVVALPAVIFPDRLGLAEALLQRAAAAGLRLEVNSLGMADRARAAGASWEAGPGLAVLNSLAARALRDWGAAAVCLSVEADRQQLEEVSRACPAPAVLQVYGRPPLLVTRVEVPRACLGEVFADRRGIRLVPRQEDGLAVYRPQEPCSLMHLRNPGIRVAHLAADLVGAPDPVAEWHSLGQPRAERAFTFNYDRRLT
ncbi:MAG: U32 family peptidase [Lentisphaerae bacterium]|nr:U32 family peptidase [Lentisphaerota bacterium]